MRIFICTWISILSLVLCISFSGEAQKLDMEWVTSVSGAGGQILTSSIAIDKDEYVYAVGNFKDSIEVPTKSGVQKIRAVSSDANALFVVKTDPAGAIEWIKGIAGKMAMDNVTGTGFDYASVTCDRNSNIYIAGCFRDTVDFDPGTKQVLKVAAPSPAEVNSYILKLNKDGVFVWVKTFYGGYNAIKDIAMDEKNGVICVTGFF